MSLFLYFLVVLYTDGLWATQYLVMSTRTNFKKIFISQNKLLLSLFYWLPKLHTSEVKLDKEHDPNIPRMDQSAQVHRILKTTLSQGKLGGKPGMPLLSDWAGQFHIRGEFLC